MKNYRLSYIIITVTIMLILLFIKTSYCQDLPDSLHRAENRPVLKDKSLSKDKPVNEIFSISLETVFNGDDLMLGFIPGMHFQNINLTAGVLFLIRPYDKKVSVERSPNFYYRLQEWRIVLGIILEKRINLVETISLSLSAGGGYTLGGYAGTSRSAETSFLPIFRIGLAKEFDNILIGLRYQYMEIPDVSSHQGNFSIMYLFKL